MLPHDLPLNGNVRVAVNWLAVLAAVLVLWWRMQRIETATDSLRAQVLVLTHEVAVVHGTVDRLTQER